jgi:hypothetical protein
MPIISVTPAFGVQRSGGVLHEADIQLWFVGATPLLALARVGSAIRHALGEPRERDYYYDPAQGYDPSDAELLKVGSSRVQLLVVRNEHHISLQAQGSHWETVRELQQRVRYAVTRHLLLPELNTRSEWAACSAAHQWGRFNRYVDIAAAAAAAPKIVNNNRVITARLVFDAIQRRDNAEAANLQPRAALTYSQLIEVAPPILRTPLLMVGNEELRDANNAEVQLYLLPSDCINSYLTLSSRGNSTNEHSMDDLALAHAEESEDLLFAHLRGAAVSGTGYERTSALLINTDPASLDVAAWKQQVPRGVNDDVQELLMSPASYDGTLASEVTRITPAKPAQARAAASSVRRRIAPEANAYMYGSTAFYDRVAMHQEPDGIQRVRVGLWLDGLHPRGDRLKANLRCAALVHDPSGVLRRYGVDMLHVIVYVNYISAQGRRYENAAPLELTFALHHHEQSAVVALPYTLDPLTKTEWAQQPVVVHASNIDMVAPGMMINRRIGVSAFRNGA